MTFYVIDDHPLMRDAIVTTLRRVRPGANVVDLSHPGPLEEAIKTHGQPELLCLDLDLKLPGLDGVEGLLKIRRSYPQVPLAIISGSVEPDWEKQCIKAGADICITKSTTSDEMVAILRFLINDGSDVVVDIETVNHGVPPKPLSRRQKELLQMIEQGLSNREIGEKLTISEHTVKVHLWRLFARLGVGSRTQALHYARNNGLLMR